MFKFGARRQNNKHVTTILQQKTH